MNWLKKDHLDQIYRVHRATHKNVVLLWRLVTDAETGLYAVQTWVETTPKPYN